MSLNTMLLRKPMFPLLPRAAARACLLSSGQTQTQTFPVGQGGRLVVDMAKAAAVVKVTAQWIDSCSLTMSRLPAGTDPDCCDVEGLRAMKQVQHLSSLDAAGLTLQADKTLAQLTLAHDQERAGEDWEGTYLVEAVVPELFSLNVSVSHGNVSVSNKLKGDCQIQLDRGDIGVGTVRGETIRLSTGRGHVKVNELEGNVDIEATADVCARLINGAKVKIDATGGGDPSVTVGALYSSGAHIASAGDVRVSSCHGRIAVHTAGTTGSVNLSSVNGTAQLSAGEGGATVHMDVMEEGTDSYIRSVGGDVNISMSQQVDADLEMAASSIKLPSTFEGDTQTDKAVGRINGARVEPSRAAARFGSISSSSQDDAGGGKIDLVGARGQSLRQYFPNDPATSSVRPKLSVMAKEGSVVLEILSWADNIVRRCEARDAVAALERNRG